MMTNSNRIAPLAYRARRAVQNEKLRFERRRLLNEVSMLRMASKDLKPETVSALSDILERGQPKMF